MATYEEVANKFGITLDQAHTLYHAMANTWDRISGDWVDCFEGGEREALKVYGSWSAMVAEATIDAGRINTYNPGADLNWVTKLPDGTWRANAMVLAEAVWDARG